MVDGVVYVVESGVRPPSHHLAGVHVEHPTLLADHQPIRVAGHPLERGSESGAFIIVQHLADLATLDVDAHEEAPVVQRPVVTIGGVRRPRLSSPDAPQHHAPSSR